MGTGGRESVTAMTMIKWTRRAAGKCFAFNGKPFVGRPSFEARECERERECPPDVGVAQMARHGAKTIQTVEIGGTENGDR